MNKLYLRLGQKTTVFYALPALNCFYSFLFLNCQGKDYFCIHDYHHNKLSEDNSSLWKLIYQIIGKDPSSRVIGVVARYQPTLRIYWDPPLT